MEAAELKIMFRKFYNSNKWELFIFFAFMVIYYLTRYPETGGRINYGDSVKWQFLPLVNGTPHPTGYPLFLIVTKLFSRIIPFHSIAERITFVSVVFGALTISILQKISFNLSTNRFASFFSALLLGFSYTFWTQATEAEVYTLNSFFVGIVIFLFIKFYQTHNQSYLFWGCFIYAVSFGNHLTMITLLPSLAYLVFVTDRSLFINKKFLIRVTFFIAIGISQYVYLYYLSHSKKTIEYLGFIGQNCDFRHFLDYITGGFYRSRRFMFPFRFNQIPDRFLLFLRLTGEQFTFIGVLMAIFGMFTSILAKSDNKVSIFLIINLLGQLLFNLNYNVIDIEVFFIPCYLIIAISISLLFKKKRFHLGLAVLFIIVLFVGAYNLEYKNIIIKQNPILDVLKDQVIKIPNKSTYFSSQLGRYVEGNTYDYINYSFFGYVNNARLFPEIKFVNELEKLSKFPEFYFAANELGVLTNLRDYKVIPYSIFSLTDLIKKYNNEIIVISAKDEVTLKLPQEFKQYMNKIGSGITNLQFRGSYAVIIKNERILIERINNKGRAKISQKELKNIFGLNKIISLVVSGGKEYGNVSSIRILGKEYSKNLRGLNIVIIDNQGNVLLSLVFDTFSDKSGCSVDSVFKAFKIGSI